MNRRQTLVAVCAVSAITLSSLAHAAWPERPITLIVPWGAGGSTDATARVVGVELEKALGQPVNVVNRTGGSGVVGHSAIAAAKPDGYTLGIITVEITQMHWQGLTKLTHEDYTPLGLFGFDANALLVRADSPYQRIDEVLAVARSDPGKLKASGTGQGGIWHLGLARWLVDNKLSGNAIGWVPSNGAAPALQDLLAGGIDVVSCALPEARALIEAGRVKPLLLMASKPDPVFPNVPLYQDASGVHWNFGGWRGIAAPKGLPQDIRNTLGAALQKISAGKAYQDFLTTRGFGAMWADGQQFAEFMSQADAEMGVVMKAVGLAK